MSVRGQLVLTWLAIGFACTQPAHAQTPTVLALVVHTAQVAGRAVAPPEFIAERIARANEIFAQYAVAFAVVEQQSLADKHARLEGREDRDLLGAYVKRGAIHCFVVDALRDVDEPERMRRGVHWHSRTHAGAHYVIVSTLGGPDVLAHELGHFLGNPEHSTTPGNLMSYEHGQTLPFLDAAQAARLQRALRGYLRRGEVRALSGASAATPKRAAE